MAPVKPVTGELAHGTPWARRMPPLMNPITATAPSWKPVGPVRDPHQSIRRRIHGPHMHLQLLALLIRDSVSRRGKGAQGPKVPLRLPGDFAVPAEAPD